MSITMQFHQDQQGMKTHIHIVPLMSTYSQFNMRNKFSSMSVYHIPDLRLFEEKPNLEKTFLLFTSATITGSTPHSNDLGYITLI